MAQDWRPVPGAPVDSLGRPLAMGPGGPSAVIRPWGVPAPYGSGTGGVADSPVGVPCFGALMQVTPSGDSCISRAFLVEKGLENDVIKYRLRVDLRRINRHLKSSASAMKSAKILAIF